MPTKIKDQATAKEAALRLSTGVETIVKPGEPIAPKESTTAEKLFPDFVTEDGTILNRPARDFKPTLAPETPVSVVQDQTPAAQTPTAPVYLRAEELTGKMVKLKVDGIEQDVPAESLIKTNQLERHLNAKLIALAEERARFESERANVTRLPIQQPPEPQKPTKQEPFLKKAPEVEALENRMNQMQAILDQLGHAVAPSLRETGLKLLDKEVRKNLGADDFMEYAPKIQEFVDNEMLKPEVQSSPVAQQQLLNSQFWYNKYQELKIKSLLSKPIANPNAPVLSRSDNSPVVLTNQGKAVSIPSIEGSGGVPSRTNPSGDWTMRAQAALDYARQTGSTDAWAAYLRIKTEST